MWKRALIALLLVLWPIGEATAGSRTVRGRILDAEGKPVAGVIVASAWTVSAEGARPIQGVTTDARGRFALYREIGSHPLSLLALDPKGESGALISIRSTDVSLEHEATLVPCLVVEGKLSTEGGKYYPAVASAWVAPAATRAPLLRLEPTKGKYTFWLPPGGYELTAQALGQASVRVAVTLRAGEPKRTLEEIDLPDREGRIREGGIAPPIVYGEATASAARALEGEHFPRRWTLCFFWAHR
ncbi:MAG: carboxypeptidase-like regulatory domain-containing protein [Planctomycetota bacterium]|nr:carboxypeptidase-like regulatory domain-containing protein [Planctomycetota bacterium]